MNRIGHLIGTSKYGRREKDPYNAFAFIDKYGRSRAPQSGKWNASQYNDLLNVFTKAQEEVTRNHKMLAKVFITVSAVALATAAYVAVVDAPQMGFALAICPPLILGAALDALNVAKQAAKSQLDPMKVYLDPFAKGSKPVFDLAEKKLKNRLNNSLTSPVLAPR